LLNPTIRSLPGAEVPALGHEALIVSYQTPINGTEISAALEHLPFGIKFLLKIPSSDVAENPHRGGEDKKEKRNTQ
jgi:hypothetical protein